MEVCSPRAERVFQHIHVRAKPPEPTPSPRSLPNHLYRQCGSHLFFAALNRLAFLARIKTLMPRPLLQEHNADDICQ